MSDIVTLFPTNDGVQARARRLRAAAGRTLNYLHRERSGSTLPKLQDMLPIDIVFEAVREGNPRQFTRKRMKTMRKHFKELRFHERKIARLHARISAYA